MSYRYYAPKRNPASLWMLDDISPFQEYSGLGHVAQTVSGSGAPTKHAALVAGADYASVFSNSKRAEFGSPVFVQGREDYPFALEVWVLVVPKTTTAPQKVLSHASAYDGITVNGTVVRFATEYLTEDPCECIYDLKTARSAHVVGVHTKNENLLYVNNVLVASQALTDEQKNDSFVATDGKLYCGESTSDQEIAVNGVALYATATPDIIAQNYDAAKRVVPQSEIYPQFFGRSFNLNSATGNQFIEYTWESNSDFKSGYAQEVAIGTSAVYPRYASGVSVAGSWTAGVALDGNGQTDIYGVMVEWSAYDVVVEGSLDGTSWTALQNGELVPMIANHANPTGLDLEVRFTFAGGLADDPAFVEYVRIVGFVNNIVENSENRAVTTTHPAVLRGNYEPIDYRDDNGIGLNGGSLTLATDVSVSPEIYRTIEYWIKPVADYTVTGFTGTVYVNGEVTSTVPAGQWGLVHIVLSADSNDPVTITGDYIIGQWTYYPTPLTADQVMYIYRSYTGRPVIIVDDTASALEVSEPATPIDIYSHNWSVEGGLV